MWQALGKVPHCETSSQDFKAGVEKVWPMGQAHHLVFYSTWTKIALK